MIPDTLKLHDQWVRYKLPSKMPLNARTGSPAKSTDPATWSSFDVCQASCHGDGNGFVFARDGGFVGIDLDGCRNPETGKLSEWAKRIVMELGSYAEVSPSQTGVKVICYGQSPWDSGKKFENLTVSRIEGVKKSPGIEVYDQGRYFTITGKRLQGMDMIKPINAKALQDAIESVSKPRVTLEQRIQNYIDAIPPAIEGQGGDKLTFTVACKLIHGWDLTVSQALPYLESYSARCEPPWDQHELIRKLKCADGLTGQRGGLVGEETPRFDKHKALKEFQDVKQPPAIEFVDAEEASREFIEKLGSVESKLFSTGIPKLDEALAGGINREEVVIVAGRPSHGKSAVGMQMVYALSAQGVKTLVVSEEMSYDQLSKRSIQFASWRPERDWVEAREELTEDMEQFYRSREKILYTRGLISADNILMAAEEAKVMGCEAVLVDYAQMLAGKGSNRYAQVSYISMTLSKISRKLGMISIILCQCNRQMEGRNSLIPNTSDLRDSGQLEQDADVIVFGVLPSRIDSNYEKDDYLLKVAKNRNRGIIHDIVKCKFDVQRMRVVGEIIGDRIDTFDDWNDD